MGIFVYHVSTDSPLELKDKLLNYSGDISVFDFHKLICEEQVILASQRAEDAFSKGYNIAKNWGIEVLLELAGVNQIERAIELLEVTEDTQIICILSRDTPLEDENFLPGFPEFQRPNSSLLEEYGITEGEECRKIIAKGATLRL